MFLHLRGSTELYDTFLAPAGFHAFRECVCVSTLSTLLLLVLLCSRARKTILRLSKSIQALIFLCYVNAVPKKLPSQALENKGERPPCLPKSFLALFGPIWHV